MRVPSTRYFFPFFLVSLWLAMIAGCSATAEQEVVAFEMSPLEGALAWANVEIVADDETGTTARGWGRPIGRAERREFPDTASGEKVGGLLRQSLEEALDVDPEQQVEFCAAVLRDFALNRLPPLDGVDRRSPEGQMLLELRTRALDATKARASASRAPVRRLVRQLGGEVTNERFLSNEVCGRLGAQDFAELQLHPSVLHIGRAPDPSDIPLPPSETIQAVSRRIGTDYLASWGYWGDAPMLYVGLIDTGVNFANTFLDADPRAFYLDCRSGTETRCTGPSPSDDYRLPQGHGTGAHSIMRNNATGENGGISAAVIDSFHVHGADYTNNLIRAMSHSLTVGDTVIVANVQAGATSGHFGVQRAANAAYQMGTAVIAAAGNTTGCETACDVVALPGAAEYVLAVGNFDTNEGATSSGQRTGGAADGRVKPDLQATSPVDVLKAGIYTFSSAGGTSFTTPQVGAAAAMVWDRLQSNGLYVEPGHVYAALLAGARTDSLNPQGDFDAGACRLEMLSTNQSVQIVGSVDVGSSATVSIPITKSNPYSMEVAWWWEDDEDTSWGSATSFRRGHHWINAALGGAASGASDTVNRDATWGRISNASLRGGTATLTFTHQTVSSIWPAFVAAPSGNVKRVYYAITYRYFPWTLSW